MHIFFNSRGSFWNCEPREWAFLCQSRTLCNIQLLLSLSFSLPLLPSPSQNSGKLDLRAASVFLLKAPHREPAGFTYSHLSLSISSDAYYLHRTWMDSCVGVFVFCTTTIFLCYLDNRGRVERTWCGGTHRAPFWQHQEQTPRLVWRRHKLWQLWETQHSEVILMIDKHCNKNPWAASLHCKNTSGADP